LDFLQHVKNLSVSLSLTLSKKSWALYKNKISKIYCLKILDWKWCNVLYGWTRIVLYLFGNPS